MFWGELENRLEANMRLNVFIAMIVLSVIISSCSSKPITKSQGIDKEITRNIDLTGDGIEDLITLHIKGENVESPFYWTLLVQSQGKEIFKYEGDGTWFNSFFGDEDYVSGCSGYVACKEKFFYQDILDRFVAPLSDFELEAMVDPSASNSLFDLGATYLMQCCGIKGEDAQSILSGMAERLRNGKAVVIQNFTSVETLDPYAATFAPEVGLFVPIYHP
jgi:hypothetical protein